MQIMFVFKSLVLKLTLNIWLRLIDLFLNLDMIVMFALFLVKINKVFEITKVFMQVLHFIDSKYVEVFGFALYSHMQIWKKVGS